MTDLKRDWCQAFTARFGESFTGRWPPPLRKQFWHEIIDRHSAEAVRAAIDYFVSDYSDPYCPMPKAFADKCAECEPDYETFAESVERVWNADQDAHDNRPDWKRQKDETAGKAVFEKFRNEGFIR